MAELPGAAAGAGPAGRWRENGKPWQCS